MRLDPLSFALGGFAAVFCYVLLGGVGFLAFVGVVLLIALLR